MTPEVKEIEGVNGPVLAVVAPCWSCGAQAEGRVGGKEADVSQAIAEQWKEEIVRGDSHLYCLECSPKKHKEIIREKLEKRRWRGAPRKGTDGTNRR